MGRIKTYEGGKLVRDQIPEVIEKRGDKAKITQVDGQVYFEYLLDKLVEEAKEVQEAEDTENLHEELGDVLEVISALFNSGYVNPLEVERLSSNKLEDRGGFNKGYVLWEMEINSDYTT